MTCYAITTTRAIEVNRPYLYPRLSWRRNPALSTSLLIVMSASLPSYFFVVTRVTVKISL